MIFQPRRRAAKDWTLLYDAYEWMLWMAHARGEDATGSAVIDTDGTVRLYKRDAPSFDVIKDAGFRTIAEGFNQHAVAVVGHTRWMTTGSPTNPRNNHPIIAGEIVGTHNGHIANADALFTEFQLARKAEVDSEVLFRLADKHATGRGLNLHKYCHDLKRVQGSLSTVMLNRRCPHEIVVVKGNSPLSCRWHSRLKVLAYASLDEWLAYACPAQEGWKPYTLDGMTATAIRVSPAMWATTTIPFALAPLPKVEKDARFSVWTDAEWREYLEQKYPPTRSAAFGAAEDTYRADEEYSAAEKKFRDAAGTGIYV
jgi:amidophosphoribosyltransferase